MNKKLVYSCLRLLEIMKNEDVYFLMDTIIEKRDFLFWLRGKGFITKEKFNYFLFMHSTVILRKIFFSAEGIFDSNDAKTLCENKALHILSEFVADNNEYFRLFNNMTYAKLDGMDKLEKSVAEYRLLQEYRMINKYNLRELI